jgi:hypothetical protein
LIEQCGERGDGGDECATHGCLEHQVFGFSAVHDRLLKATIAPLEAIEA